MGGHCSDTVAACFDARAAMRMAVACSTAASFESVDVFECDRRLGLKLQQLLMHAVPCY
jgi:hypothetical protein